MNHRAQTANSAWSKKTVLENRCLQPNYRANHHAMRWVSRRTMFCLVVGRSHRRL